MWPYFGKPYILAHWSNFFFIARMEYWVFIYLVLKFGYDTMKHSKDMVDLLYCLIQNKITFHFQFILLYSD